MSGTRMSICMAAALAVLPGCLVPKTQVNEAQAENRVFSAQNKAQLAEIDNLKAHARNVENKLMQAKEELAIVQQQAELDRRQLASFETEHADLVDRYRAVAKDSKMPPALGKQLQELSRRHPSLHFDADSGMSKLDTDVLFESGDAELKPAAERMLAELARVLRAPEASGLKIMVVGHTDSLGVGRKPVREKYGDNFQISTARAVAVAACLKREGVPESRLGVAGLGASQPVAPNDTAENRLKNRRVEIFVAPVEIPVIGWTDSTPGMYRR